MELNLAGLSAMRSREATQHAKILILGSGPAGLTAALYSARAEMQPLVLTGIEIGGQASLTFTIENYPGFPEGIGGSKLGELFQKQAERFGARVELDSASEVDLSKRPFVVKTYDTTYTADALIITTGASPNHLDIPGEEEFTGRGVSYCATCDGWFFKDKNVVVVGGGDSALEEGIFLTRYAKSVTIIHRRDTLRAGAVLQKRAFENPKIDFRWNSVMTKITGDEKTRKIYLKNTQDGTESSMETDGVFIFIGHTPNTAMVKGQVDLDEHGYIRTDALMQTSVPGVFAAGEVSDPVYRQVITSAGMGAAAAMQAVRYLEHQEQSAAEPLAK
jgi:thioredoxin reductase (NADPH)